MTIKQKQLLLCWFGHLEPGDVDGIWGSQSAAATAQLQRQLGLTADGVWGDETDTAIRERIYSGEDIPEEPETTGTFWDSIEFFSRDEFRCKCGGRFCNGFPAEPREDLVRLADGARRHFGNPATVISGLRCSQHNANEGGVVNSQHIYGEAVDLQIQNISADQLLAYIQAQPGVRYAYAINGTNVHFDVPKGDR